MRVCFRFVCEGGVCAHVCVILRVCDLSLYLCRVCMLRFKPTSSRSVRTDRRTPRIEQTVIARNA